MEVPRRVHSKVPEPRDLAERVPVKKNYVLTVLCLYMLVMPVYGCRCLYSGYSGSSHNSLSYNTLRPVLARLHGCIMERGSITVRSAGRCDAGNVLPETLLRGVAYLLASPRQIPQIQTRNHQPMRNLTIASFLADALQNG